MAVTVVGGTSAHGANPTLPVGTVATDYLVLGVGCHGDFRGPVGPFTWTVAGWTKLSEDNVSFGGDPSYLGFAMFGAPASVGAPSISSTNFGDTVSVLGSYRGVNLTTPVTGPGGLLYDSGGVSRLIPSPGGARTGSAIVGVLMVADNVSAAAWGGNPPNEPPGTNLVSREEVTGANSSIHQGYRAGIDGGDTQLWVIGGVTFEPEPPVVELEFLVNWAVIERGLARAILLRPA